MVEHCGLNLEAAVGEFAVSTSPGIYMRHYLTVRGCLSYVGGPADMILCCAVFVFSIGTILRKRESELHIVIEVVTDHGVIYTPLDAPYNLGVFECEEPIF